MTKEEKELFNERFSGLTSLINAQFESIEDRLKRIEDQTTKTNGRVTELEHKELTHIITCPVVSKVEKINDDLAEYKIMKKYPKLGIAVIAGAVLIFIAATFTGIEKAKKNFTEESQAIVKELVQEIQTMTDTLQLW